MTDLKDLVRQRVDVQWDAWAARHPNLAAAIDRVRFSESIVDRLRQDPAYLDAMREANLNETQLLAAACVLQVVERMVGVGLRL